MPNGKVSCALLIAVALLGIGPIEAAETALVKRPNVIIMLTDNLGWGEIGVYGSVRGVPTPRIDRLASEGMRLTNFNVEYSCVVSRAALLTGRYAVRTGAVQRERHHAVGSDDRGSPEALGYATGHFGKWHLGGEKDGSATRADEPGIRRVVRHSADQ